MQAIGFERASHVTVLSTSDGQKHGGSDVTRSLSAYTLLSILLIDIPALALVAVYAHEHPLRAVENVIAWREAHPESMLPTLLVLAWLLYRLVRRNTA